MHCDSRSRLTAEAHVWMDLALLRSPTCIRDNGNGGCDGGSIHAREWSP